MNSNATEASLYLHVAFCETKCPYCDFNTYAGIAGLIPRYLNALETQCALLLEVAPATDDAVRPEQLRVASIFFGGGTPSLIGAAYLKRILEAVGRSSSVNLGAEITLEANPNDVSVAYLQSLREAGFNRLSMGVQSFDDQMLRVLGRRHNGSTAAKALESARVAGFDNVSLDLMYGLPGQPVEHWQRTLNQAIQLQPEHLSLYSLTIEADTPFHGLEAQGRITLPTQDEQAEMYEVAMDRLDYSGYYQYEVSNWARHDSRDLRSQHNLRYWRNQPYIGLGAGAHSYFMGSRFSMIKAPQRYIEDVESGGTAVDWSETIDPELEMAETAVLGLRLNEGLSRRELRGRFGRKIDDAFRPVVERWVDLGLLTANDDWIRLTKRGRMLGNEVFESFMARGVGGAV